MAVVLGLLRFRRISALPDAFGVAFLLDEKDPSHLDHLPCERALYPGVDLAAKKRAFIGFDTFSGTDGSILAEQIWEQNTH